MDAGPKGGPPGGRVSHAKNLEMGGASLCEQHARQRRAPVWACDHSHPARHWGGGRLRSRTHCAGAYEQRRRCGRACHRFVDRPLTGRTQDQGSAIFRRQLSVELARHGRQAQCAVPGRQHPRGRVRLGADDIHAARQHQLGRCRRERGDHQGAAQYRTRTRARYDRFHGVLRQDECPAKRRQDNGEGPVQGEGNVGFPADCRCAFFRRGEHRYEQSQFGLARQRHLPEHVVDLEGELRLRKRPKHPGAFRRAKEEEGELGVGWLRARARRALRADRRRARPEQQGNAVHPLPRAG